MGDGQVASNGLRLCTDSFSLPEVIKLMNVLIVKYRINCSINNIGGKPRIYISAKSLILLTSIVKHHMNKDMFYKLERVSKLTPKEQNTNTFLKGSLGLKTITHVKNFATSVYIQKRTFSRISVNKSILPGPRNSYLAGLFEGDGHI
jgi:hypothetical protein